MTPDARRIVQSLKGRWSGRSGSCRCPAHEDRSPSLSVTEAADGAVLVHCHAGCEQGAVIDALKSQGLWPDKGWTPRVIVNREDVGRDDEKRIFLARNVWTGALIPVGPDPVQYLRNRGITLKLPPTIRFDRIKHPSDGRRRPALIFAIQNGAGRVTGVQRIYMNDDCTGKADVEPVKATLGVLGDGAVRFGEAHAEVGLAEGPETALSAMQMFGMPVWCSCGAGRMKRVAFPPIVKTVHIFADAGPAGTKAARDALEVFEGQGRNVVVRAPAIGDWNDVLRGLT